MKAIAITALAMTLALIILIILFKECDESFTPPSTNADVQLDRVYTADQNSNTVSVIDPAKNTLLGLIELGNPRPDILNPLYKGDINVHGLGFSPDGKHICVVAHGTHSVNVVETKSNKVVARKFVGAAPHECFFTADGNEIWVSVRGEDYLSVLGAEPVPRSKRPAGVPQPTPTLKEKARVYTIPGPGMVIFSSDGKYAYANNSFHPVFQMIDVKKRKVIKTLKGLRSPFSPFLFFSPSEKDIWLTHKDSGYVTRIANVNNPKKIHVAETVKTGLVTNHLFVVRKKKNGPEFVYVTVGGEDVVKVYKVGEKGEKTKLAAVIPVPARPHGIWSNAPSREAPSTRVYVGSENEDAVTVIDVATDQVIAVIDSGQAPQALIYVPKAVSDPSDGVANLVPLPPNQPALSYLLYAPGATDSSGFVGMRYSGRSVKMLTINAFGLEAHMKYRVYLITTDRDPQEVARFRANDLGMGHVETVGPPELWPPAIEAEAEAEAEWRLEVTNSKQEVVLETRNPNRYSFTKQHGVP